MNERLGALLAVGAAVAQGGCNGGGAGSADIRGDAVMVWQGSNVDSSCDKPNPVDCPVELPTITDALRDGGRIGLAGMFGEGCDSSGACGQGVPFVFLSDDTGKTWQPFTAIPSLNTLLPSWVIGTWWLYLAEGRVFVLAELGSGGVGNTTAIDLQYDEFEPTTGTFVSDWATGTPRLPRGALYRGGGSLLDLAYSAPPPTLVYATVDPLMPATPPVAGAFAFPNGVGSPVTTANGVHWEGLDGYGDTQGANVCRMKVDYPPTGFEQLCVDAALWPANLADVGTTPFSFVVPALNVAYQLYAYKGEAYAITIPSDGVMGTPIDLGLGTPLDPTAFFSGLPAFGDLLPIKGANGAPDRLVRIDASGNAVEVHLPHTPCNDETQPCGVANDALPVLSYGEMLSAIPMGDKTWMAFYVVRTFDGTAQQSFLYALTVGETEGPITPGGEGGAPPPIPAYPGAIEGGPLEKTCARAASCLGIGAGPGGIGACIQHWRAIQGKQGGQDAAYATFLATPAGCPAFERTWPEAFVAGTPGCVDPGCDGNIARVCAPSTGTSATWAFDCTPRGGVCHVDGTGTATCADAAIAASSCNQCDPAGHAIVCSTGPLEVSNCAALGLSCAIVTGGPLCTEGACGASSCTGAVFHNCEVGYWFEDDDCTRVPDHTCTPNGCQPASPSKAGACQLLNGATTCGGPYLLYCADGEQRYVDCRSIGFSACQPDMSGGEQSVCQ